LFAGVLFLPLLRYATQDPTGFVYRMASRMGTMEQPLPGPAGAIFLDNLWRALAMFSWSSGVVWGVSIPDYPALSVVTGGLFYLGAALVFFRYLRRRHWLDLFLLVSIPILMLPSILSLAFPAENPNLYRTGGAMVPVFLLVAIALDGLLSGLERSSAWGSRAVLALGITLVALSAVQDYDLVFNKFYAQYRQSAWNYSEAGQVVRDFSQLTGSTDTAWVVGYPHWLDTRLVEIAAGQTGRDNAIFVETLADTASDPRPKLFIVHPNHQEALDALRQLYPQGWLQNYQSQVETKDFWMYFVPADQ
jgi:hypothetical protein